MKYKSLIISSILLMLAQVAHAEQIGSVDTVFKMFGPDHKIVVEAFDDPAAKAMFVNAALPLSPLLVSASGLAGAGGKPMGVRRVNSRFVIVGDGESEVSAAAPPLAPRVMQAAGLQADVVLAFFLQEAANASSS